MLLTAGLAVAAKALHAQTAGSSDGSSAGRLYDPGAVGRPRVPTAPGDANSAIQAIEQKLACHCGCTLDIFTCRTTDFTCTTSPRLHQEVVALYQDGAGTQEILDTFVAKYGEEALMAPEPRGFNLAGYLVPGFLILLIGSVIAWVIGRRFRLSGGGADPATRVAELEPASAEGEERLRRALAEVED